MERRDETLYKQEYDPTIGDFVDSWEPMFEGCRDYSYKCPKCGHSES